MSLAGARRFAKVHRLPRATLALLPTRVPILVTALLRSPPSPRPSLPRAVRSAPPATQSPWRLRSAGFTGVDLPIFHTARIAYPTGRAGLGFHTRRSRLLGCAMAPLVIPFWGLSGSNGVLWVLDRVYALGRGFYLVAIIWIFPTPLPGAYAEFTRAYPRFASSSGTSAPSIRPVGRQFRCPNRAPATHTEASRCPEFGFASDPDPPSRRIVNRYDGPIWLRFQLRSGSKSRH